MRTLWQVNHLPSIWLKLDDRAGIKKKHCLSLVIKTALRSTWTAASELSGPETRERKPHRRRGLGLSDLIYPIRDHLISNRLPVWYTGSCHRPALEIQASRTHAIPLLGFFTSPALPKGRSNQQDSPPETSSTFTVNGQHSSKHLFDIHFSAPGSIPRCSSVPGIPSDTTPFL